MPGALGSGHGVGHTKGVPFPTIGRVMTDLDTSR